MDNKHIKESPRVKSYLKNVLKIDLLSSQFQQCGCLQVVIERVLEGSRGYFKTELESGFERGLKLKES